MAPRASTFLEVTYHAWCVRAVNTACRGVLCRVHRVSDIPLGLREVFGAAYAPLALRVSLAGTAQSAIGGRVSGTTAMSFVYRN